MYSVRRGLSVIVFAGAAVGMMLVDGRGDARELLSRASLSGLPSGPAFPPRIGGFWAASLAVQMIPHTSSCSCLPCMQRQADAEVS